jgi:hypothetical protein
VFAGRLTPVPRRVNRVSTEFAALFPQMASDEIAAAAGGADLRLSWREGVTGRRPRIGSGLSGQASAFYRCSSCTPRLRTFFIVQDASWQARGWAGLRMARFGGRGSGCARSSPLARGQRCREICICPVVSGRRLGAHAGTKMPAAHAATAAPSTADKRPSLRWCGWRGERARRRCQPASGMAGTRAEMVRQPAFSDPPGVKKC